MTRTFRDGMKAGKEEAMEVALRALDQPGATIATARSAICVYIKRTELGVDWVHPVARRAMELAERKTNPDV